MTLTEYLVIREKDATEVLLAIPNQGEPLMISSKEDIKNNTCLVIRKMNPEMHALMKGVWTQDYYQIQTNEAHQIKWSTDMTRHRKGGKR